MATPQLTSRYYERAVRRDVGQRPKETRGESLFGCRGFQPYGRLSLSRRCHVSVVPVLDLGLGLVLVSSHLSRLRVLGSHVCLHRPAHEPRTKQNEDKLMAVSRVSCFTNSPRSDIVMQM